MKKLFIVILVFIITGSQFRAYSQKLELEDAVLSDCSITDFPLTGYSGTGYVTGFNNKASIELTVNVPEGGIYDIYISYELDSDDSRIMQLSNHLGSNGQTFAPSPGTFMEGDNIRLSLSKGDNVITFKTTGRNFSFNLDYARVVKYEKILNPDKNLVNPNATPEAKALYDYFLSIYGKGIVSGQTDTVRCNYVASITDHLPKVCAFDFMDYTANKELNMDAPIKWAQNGGIVAFQWHWRDPMTKNGNFYAYPQYDNGTSFDASKIFETESPEYAAMIEDIDYVASQLKILQDKGIPVLWRPLHEATGNDWDIVWFWWSNGSGDNAAACKQLWKVMYDRMVNHHGLNNLIWTWNTGGSAREEKWYPGDETVDMVGADVYNGKPNSSWSSLFDKILLRHGNRMIAMTECGSTPDPEKLQEDGAYWLYFCVWGDYIIDHCHENRGEVLIKAYADPYMISLPRPEYVDYPRIVECFTGLETPEDGFEAEDAQYSEGMTVDNLYDGYTKEGYVGGFANDGDNIVFTVESRKSQEYDLFIRYIIPMGFGQKGIYVSVNGGENTETMLKNDNGEFNDSDPIKISLNKGTNTIKLTKSWGYHSVDHIRIPGITASIGTAIHSVQSGSYQVTMDKNSLLQYTVPESDKIESISIHSVNGQLIEKIPVSVNAYKGTINCQALIPGVYIISFNGTKEASFKVIR